MITTVSEPVQLDFGIPMEVHIGSGSDGSRWGYLSAAGHEGVGLSLPDDLDDAQALRVLAYWPAWRLVEAARLELGSNVLVIGSGWLARSVLRLCRFRGCLHRTICGPHALADEAEKHIAEPSTLSTSTLPTPPDAIFVLEDAARHLAAALPLCDTKGTVVVADVAPTVVDLNFYPDAHKRGLHIVPISIFDMNGAGAQWERAGRLLARLARCAKLEVS